MNAWDARLVARLRAAGHDVLYVAEIARAENDIEVLDRAQGDGRLSLTEDKDFGDLVFRRGQPVPGLVLLRVDPTMQALKGERLENAIERCGDHLFGRYVIVEEARFRSRPLRK